MVSCRYSLHLIIYTKMSDRIIHICAPLLTRSSGRSVEEGDLEYLSLAPHSQPHNPEATLKSQPHHDSFEMQQQPHDCICASNSGLQEQLTLLLSH